MATRTETSFSVQPRFLDPEHYEVVDIKRVTVVYPVTKAGSVQWSQGERRVETIAEVPVRHIAALIGELVDTLAYTVTGECKNDYKADSELGRR
ncbi:hypothetical protein [Rhodococcus phage REQ1]|uniref:hypothetical protein n=1 Tax=Rhodococcus phage REQ1 TaxID=1109712 RepID=UPI00023EEBF2|nr:hypothetical protein RoPhREQ1_gp17 [Rhodococcus phage REQ1]AEV52013.1 hypothetical protein [Rhodococcus phage REQ1]